MYPVSQLLNDIWAKSSGEPLIDHTYRVLSVLAQLRRRLPQLSKFCEEPHLWHWAFWSCFFHDLGKAARTFQSYLRGKCPFWHHRHEIFSLAFMQVFQFAENDYPWIVAGVASHHKDAGEIVEGRYNLLAEPEDLALEELKDEIDEKDIDALLSWLKHSPKKWIEENNYDNVEIPKEESEFDIKDFISNIPDTILSALKRYNDLVQMIGNEPSTGIKNRAAIFLRGLITQADHLASANAPEINMATFPDIKELTMRLGIKQENLRSHQTYAASVIGSIVFSAPTGSGKTEAALLWAHNQQVTSNIQRHLVYILPYQASLNAIYRRFKNLLGIEVALIHGRSLQALYREMREKGYTLKETEIAAKRANDLARLFQPPIWCTTPYQLLKAAYRLPGYEAIWTAMSGALFVIDEVHAYEPSKLGMFVALLSELCERWGVSLCVMSATMPSWVKKILISLVGNDLQVDKELFKAFQRHRIEVNEGSIFDFEIREIIMKEALSGKSVLVGVNTIHTAQEVTRILKVLLGPERVILIHSRLTTLDRLNKEEKIMRELDTEGGEKSLAVVATQVLEVSLDLDFDTIITEPAPLEALIQRFGRVNRRGKKGIVPVRILTRSIDGEKVYDPDLVSRAMNVLISKDGSIIDELKVNEWLDEVYAGIENKFADEVLRHKEEFETSCLKSVRAFNSSPQLVEQFDKLFDNTEVLPKCLKKDFERLYEESVIEAKSLLVPISWKQCFRNRDFITWDKERSVRVIDKRYNSDVGLIL